MNKQAIKITVQFGSCKEDANGIAKNFVDDGFAPWRGYITEARVAQTEDGGFELVKENAGKIFKWALQENQ